MWGKIKRICASFIDRKQTFMDKWLEPFEADAFFCASQSELVCHLHINTIKCVNPMTIGKAIE